MHITVLNGSPKGAYSITLQTVRYLAALYPEHTFEEIAVGQKIRALEKDLTPAIEAMNRADLILFSYPVYTFIAPWQMHRFLELIRERGVCPAGKFAAQITTSKHFYDITAHRYIEDMCSDLGLRYVSGLSADMDDLLSEKGQKEAREFFDYILFCMERSICREPSPTPMILRHMEVDVPAETEADKPGDIAVVTNCAEDDIQLKRMIDRFAAVMPRKVRVVNIREYPFSGGCLGCFNCAVSGKCIYKDGFDDYLRQTIQTAEAIVYAFTVQDHSMGASFKLYDDRQFCNGHRTVTMGMPMGYLVSGQLSRERNLQTIIEARAQVGGNFLAGVATDEEEPNSAIDKLAASLEYALQTKYAPPANFWGVGGMKIFRDLIWLMQGMMRADHKFYKAHGQYDFPQKKRGMMLKMYLVGALLSSPKIKAKMGNAMNEGMLAPYKKVLDGVKKEK